MPRVAKKKTIAHPTIEQKNEQKPQARLLDTFYNFLTGAEEILTVTGAERLARELIAWATTDETALKIGQFLELQGINRKTWDGWLKRFPVLADANDFALMVLGNRREVGLLNRKYDSQSTTFTMMHYDPEWREMFAMKAKMMNAEGLAAGQRIVVIEKFPDSPMVPVKIEAKE